MTDEQLAGTGEFCLNLLTSEPFNALVEHYQMGRVADLLSTKPEQQEARERVYAQINGLRDFLDFLKPIAVAYDHSVNGTPEVVADTPEDDPSVHDIFQGID